MSSDARPKMQVFFGIEDPSRIRRPTQIGQDQPDPQTATPVALSPQTNNPIIKVVETLSKIDTSSPEAKLNKDSMADNNGGRIKFNDELTGSQTLKGVEDPSRLPNKKP